MHLEKATEAKTINHNSSEHRTVWPSLRTADDMEKWHNESRERYYPLT